MTKEQTYWINTDGERHIATGTDLEEILASIAQTEERKKAEEIEQNEKAAAKSAILQRLGISEDELKVVLG